MTHMWGLCQLMVSWSMASIDNSDHSSGSSSWESSESDALELSYDSSAFGESDGSSNDDEIVPFMYEPIASSSSSGSEDSDDSLSDDPRLLSLDW